MRFKTIGVQNYKNIENVTVQDIADLVMIKGDNAAGKTSFLDALFYLVYTKSFTHVKDSFLVKKGSENAFVKVIVEERSKSQEYSFSLTKEQKTFKTEGKKYKRLADHIGAIPLAVISPYDLDIVFGSSSDRRKYLDLFISAFDKKYLDCLIQHNKLIKVRNKLLKEGSAYALMEVYDFKIEQLGGYIFETRGRFVAELESKMHEISNDVISGAGDFSLGYQSALQKMSYYEVLKNNYEKDLRYQFTTAGIHRDDFSLLIEGNDLKVFGSQGQQKLFLNLLKISQCLILFEEFKSKPILLIDDLSDKLDKKVTRSLCEVIDKAEFIDQVFITDQNTEIVDYFTNRSKNEILFANGEIKEK